MYLYLSETERPGMLQENKTELNVTAANNSGVEAGKTRSCCAWYESLSTRVPSYLAVFIFFLCNTLVSHFEGVCSQFWRMILIGSLTDSCSEDVF